MCLPAGGLAWGREVPKHGVCDMMATVDCFPVRSWETYTTGLRVLTSTSYRPKRDP